MTSLADSEIHPPAYPLDRDAFRRALKTGHGRALVHARDFGLADFRDDVLDAATDSKVYDTQIDGQREWWLARLCEHAGLVDTIIAQAPGHSTRDLDLRACLLRQFHLRGHEVALPALYAMCRYWEDPGNVEAIGELIEIEGEKGLVFAARVLGETLLAHSGFWVSDYEACCYDELYGAGRAKEVLTEAAETDPAIRHYLEELKAYEERSAEVAGEPRPDDFGTVGEVIQTILSATKRVGLLRRWGNNASPEDRGEVARLLKTESRVPVLLNAIWCLKGKGLPTFDATLLELVFHQDQDVRFHAGQMFSHHENPQVRAAGLKLLDEGDVVVATELLQMNANAEDVGRILSACVRISDDWDYHSAISSLVTMAENNPSARDPSILLHVYEFSPCMHCREKAAELLVEWKMCPAWLLEEAAFDGSEDIRKLAGGLKE